MSYTVCVLLSGHGSTLQALIEQQKKGGYVITQVISNRADAYGLQRARTAGITQQSINPKNYPDRATFEDALATCIEHNPPDLLVLAGFMHVLGPAFIARFPQGILNIHPSLLPAYPGLNTYARALADHASHHGTTVHQVTADLDAGPILAQSRIPIHPGDSIEQLKTRTQHEERRLYPRVLACFASQALRIHHGVASFKHKALPFKGLSDQMLNDSILP
jgi:phosphoribosylglycinamide formyltransferase 1